MDVVQLPVRNKPLAIATMPRRCKYHASVLCNTNDNYQRHEQTNCAAVVRCSACRKCAIGHAVIQSSSYPVTHPPRHPPIKPASQPAWQCQCRWAWWFWAVLFVCVIVVAQEPQKLITVFNSQIGGPYTDMSCGHFRHQRSASDWTLLNLFNIFTILKSSKKKKKKIVAQKKNHSIENSIDD